MKVLLGDHVVIHRYVELPDVCPRCKAKIEPGTVLTGWQMRPRYEKLRLTRTKDKNKTTELAETVNAVRWGDKWSVRVPLDYRCPCNYILAEAHPRAYELTSMDKLTAFKLRGLLYDSNAKDPQVLRKCYDESQGYHGDCAACNIEADIGTEEVPHPIDARLHTCNRDWHELNQP